MNRLIEWFARNGVAANILLISIVAAGVYYALEEIVLREWPDYPSRTITASVAYRGSTPAEVEESIVMRIEEAVFDVSGVKEMNSFASEGSGTVRLEIENGFSLDRALDEIKDRVDSINTFPAEAERPSVRLADWNERLITVVVSGDLSERDLTRLGERIRDEITALPSITLAGLKVARPYEIAIEVSEAALKRYGLRLEDVAQAVRRSSVNLSAGSIRTSSGDILLRTSNQAYRYEDFAEIVVLARPDGTRVTLADVGKVIDGFDEMPIVSRYNGRRAVIVDVFRSGDQNILQLAEEVKDYIRRKQAELPEGILIETWDDDSQRVSQRLQTLAGSAVMGFALVILVLSLFLRPSLALWVSLGLPAAFAGAFIVMYLWGVSLNLSTLFAFILVLGIVVDDAIVTGENVFHHMQRGVPALEASIKGAQEVAVPVTFGVATTVVAFFPLQAMSGWLGNNLKQIPLVVIPVLLFSLVESKLILPAHLKHCQGVGKGDRSRLNILSKVQRKVADGLERFVQAVYQPALDWCLRNRYLALSLFVGVLVVTVSLLLTDRLTWNMYPRVPRDQVNIRLSMPAGTPFEVTRGHVERMERIALDYKSEINERFGKEIVKTVFATAGGQPMGRGWGGRSVGIPEQGEVVVELEAQEVHGEAIGAREVSNALRERIGPIPGAERFSLGYWRGDDESISIRLVSPSFDDLREASRRIQEKLAEYAGLHEFSDSFESAKAEFELALKPQAEYLGISAGDLARQVRQAFFGAEAQRIQRGRDDVRVMVRYPLEERKSLETLDTMTIRAPGGAEVPFSSVAAIEPGRSLPTIHRVDRRRQITVSANAESDEVDTEAILAELEGDFIPALVAEYPNMEYVKSGRAQQQEEDSATMRLYTALVLFAIYVLLAIPFRSYVKPFLVMAVIPFGIVGAIFGHFIMDWIQADPVTFNIMSILGFLALSGVVVNDSLVLVHHINSRVEAGESVREATRLAGARRFRPILLTSLTTFAGLLPLMFETSRQAKFMVPMAISLGWGIVFSTVVTLLLVPVNTLILEDLKALLRRYWAWQTGGPAAKPALPKKQPSAS